MPINEASEKYKIPFEVLKEYESWEWRKAAKKGVENYEYDDIDLERLSLMMTLLDTGFDFEEIKTYFHLLSESETSESERMRILNRKRVSTLEEIHLLESRLDRLDYLRHQISEDKKPVPVRN